MKTSESEETRHACTHTNRRLVVPGAHERIGRAWNSSWNSSFFIAFFFSVCIEPPCPLAFSDQAYHNFRQAAGLAAGGPSRNPVKQSRETVKHSHRCFFPGWLTPAMLGWQGVEQPTCPCLEPHGSGNQKYQRMWWMQRGKDRRRTDCIWRNEDEDSRESIRTASKVHSWNTRTLAGNCMLSIIDINKEWEEREQT